MPPLLFRGKEELSRPALLLIVHSRCLTGDLRDAPTHPKSARHWMLVAAFASDRDGASVQTGVEICSSGEGPGTDIVHKSTSCRLRRKAARSGKRGNLHV
jgi:hypothetical protein